MSHKHSDGLHDEDQHYRNEMARAIRSVPKNKGTRLEQLREIVAHHQANRVEGLFVDMYSASIVCQIHDALNDANKAKLLRFPLRRMVEICYQLAKKA